MNRYHNTAVQNKLVAVSQAVATLGSLELAIASITIGRSQSPVIAILPGAGCRHLQSAITKHITRNGRRIIEKVSFIDHCQVRWEETAHRSQP